MIRRCDTSRALRCGALCIAILANACSSGTDEGSGFQRIVGKFCGEQGAHSLAVQDDQQHWVVTLRYDTQQTVVVTDRNGVLREQTQRDCGTTIVILDLALAQTARDAIDLAATNVGVTPVY